MIGEGKAALWAVSFATFIFALYTFASYFLTPFILGIWAAIELFFIFLAAAGIGRVIVGLLEFSDVSGSKKTLIGATLGLGVLSLGILFLAVTHHLSVFSVASFLALLWIAGFSEMRPMFSSLGSARKIILSRPLWIFPIFFSLTLVFWACLTPPHQYDALVYHLPLAQAYVRAHALTRLPWLLYMHFPQNGEMLFTLALVLKSDILAQMFMGLALFLSAWWIFEIGRLEMPLDAVMLSILILVTQTSVMLLSATTYVEALVMLWTSAAVMSFLRWEEIRSASPDSREWLILSAIFTGLGLGTKYYAGITAGLLGAWLWGRFIFAASNRKCLAKDAALFTALVTIVFSPWLIKNWLWAGNPFFPFFNPLFPQAGQGWNNAVAVGYFKTLTEYRTGLSYLGNLATLPTMLLTNSLRFGRGMDVLGGLGWEIIFWTLPLSFWASRKNQFLRRMLVFTLLYLVIWFLTGVVLRFLIALAPILCFLAGSSLEKLYKTLGKSGRALLSAALASIVITHLLLFAFINFGVFDAGRVLLGLESRKQYLSRRLAYYPCARYASEHLEQNGKILIVGEQRSYYVSPPSIASSIFAPNAFFTLANTAKNSKELENDLREQGIKQILIVPNEMTRLGAAIGEFTPLGRDNFKSLLKDREQTAYQGPACSLLSLK
jgi:hypothetical protein